MNGVHAAFEGRIGKDAEVRSTRDGKPWASFPVAVDALGCGRFCGALRANYEVILWSPTFWNRGSCVMSCLDRHINDP
jgi:hypothetical protein